MEVALGCRFEQQAGGDKTTRSGLTGRHGLGCEELLNDLQHRGGGRAAMTSRRQQARDGPLGASPPAVEPGRPNEQLEHARQGGKCSTVHLVQGSTRRTLSRAAYSCCMHSGVDRLPSRMACGARQAEGNQALSAVQPGSRPRPALLPALYGCCARTPAAPAPRLCQEATAPHDTCGRTPSPYSAALALASTPYRVPAPPHGPAHSDSYGFVVPCIMAQHWFGFSCV